MVLDFEDVLVNNMVEFRKQESETLTAGYDKSELISYLRQRAAKNAKIMTENNQIIDQKLRPLLKNSHNITDDDADALFVLAQRFFSHNKSLDMGLALEIHKSLVDRAREREDLDRLIPALYHAGFINQQIHTYIGRSRRDTLAYLEEAAGLFAEAAHYKEQYFQIKSKQTRMYINRCLGNVYVAVGGMRNINLKMTAEIFFKAVDEAVAFWNDEKVRELDPDFPWEAFIINSHQNITAWDDVLRDLPAEKREPLIVKRVCDSFETLAKNEASVTTSQYWTLLRTKLSKLTSSYYLKKISQNDYINQIREICQATKTNDYSDNGLYGVVSISALLIQNLRTSGQAESVEGKLEIEYLMKRLIEYFKNAPSGSNRPGFFNKYLGGLARVMHNEMDFETYLDLLLRFTSYGHMYTYIHAVQVRKLMEIFTKYFLKCKPQEFIGIFDTKTVGDVFAQSREILDLVLRVAPCHDVGKISYIDMVSKASRKLYDFEFSIIKEHAEIQELEKFDNEIARCIADVVHGHHKWYDGSAGYPKWFDSKASKYKFIIDMVSVADAIDAATDAVGRSYANTLSLEQVLEEIHRGAGTRYSPVISEALKDLVLVEEIRSCITGGREATYYEFYLDCCQEELF